MKVVLHSAPVRHPKNMEQTPQLNTALAKAKLEFPKILENKNVKIPTKSGREISFAYAELEEIADAVTPSLCNFGLAIVSQLSFLEDKFCLVTTLRHESGEAIASYFPFRSTPVATPKTWEVKSAMDADTMLSACWKLQLLSLVVPSKERSK